MAGRFADLRADLRTAIRSLRHAPLTSLGSLVTLAIGIGATTALFSVANGVLFKPLPFPNADRLVVVSGSPIPGWPSTPLSFADATDIAGSGVFESFGSWMATSESRVPLSADHDPEEVQFAIASASFFDVLGVMPVEGRTFTTADDQLGAPPTVIVTHGLWQRRFGPATRLNGQTLALDGRPHDIVGVLPPGFRFATLARDPDVWLPLSRDANPGRRFSRGTRYLVGVGRLKEGQSLDAARSGMAVLSAGLAKQFPQFYKGRGFDVTRLSDRVSGGLRAPLALLLGAVVFVLLLACANVAGLLLARGSERQREMAIRTAMGASRWRLARQMLVECAVLSTAAGVAGILIAVPGVRVLSTLMAGTPSPFVPYTFQAGELGIDLRVLAFTAVVSLLTGVLFGMAPAWQASRTDPHDTLAQTSHGGSPGRRRLRVGLVTAEIALSLVLLAGAGLLIQSLLNLERTNPGFDAENVLAMDLLLPGADASPQRTAAFFEAVLTRLQALPGVSAAAFTEVAPLSGSDQSTSLYVDGRPIVDAVDMPRAHHRSVSAGYFELMDIHAKDGRTFSDWDTAGSARVAIVNETLARQLWPGEPAVGKRIALDFEALRFYRDRAPQLDLQAGWREVIGVVGDVRHAALQTAPPPEAYVPATQRPVRAATVLVRAVTPPADLARGARAQVAGVDPRQPVANVRTLEDSIYLSAARPRSTTRFLSALALVGLLLAVIGIYSIVAHMVAARTREIGVRMALGATRRQVLWLVMRHSLAIGAAGIGCGLVAAIALAGLLQSALVNTAPRDPMILAAAAMMLLAVTAAASAMPARRAMRIDPVTTLRAE
jgi:putative ABC transport system permease protein